MAAFATELMPDNMGFPAKAGMKSKVCGEALGLRVHICAICGKRFEVSFQYRYKIEKKNKTRWYCCYSHFRVDEAKECANYKRVTLGKWKPTNERTPRQRIEAEIAKCAKHLADWQARYDDRTVYGQLSSKKRAEINRQIVNWRTRLLVAEAQLEELEKP